MPYRHYVDVFLSNKCQASLSKVQKCPKVLRDIVFTKISIKNIWWIFQNFLACKEKQLSWIQCGLQTFCVIHFLSVCILIIVSFKGVCKEWLVAWANSYHLGLPLRRSVVWFSVPTFKFSVFSRKFLRLSLKFHRHPSSAKRWKMIPFIDIKMDNDKEKIWREMGAPFE